MREGRNRAPDLEPLLLARGQPKRTALTDKRLQEVRIRFFLPWPTPTAAVEKGVEPTPERA